MFYPPSITAQNRISTVLGPLFKEMSRLRSDCNGFLDFRMVLILLLLGGGLGGFTLFSKPGQTEKPTPPPVTQTDLDKEKEEEKNKAEAEKAIQEADRQAEDMIDSALYDADKKTQAGASVGDAFTTFSEDVQKAQADFRENVNSGLVNLALGVSFQDTIEEATATFQADLEKAQSRFQQSLADAVAAEAEPQNRPIIFDLACDVADSIVKVNDPSAKACNRSPSSPGNRTVAVDKDPDTSQAPNEGSSGGSVIDGVNIQDIGREDPTTAADYKNESSSGGSVIDGVNIQDIGREDPTTAADYKNESSSGGSVIDGVNIQDIGREDPTTTADDKKDKHENLLEKTGEFPTTGLYRGNELVVDGWPISCGDRPIFVADTLDEIPNANWRPDFEIKDYTGGSYSRDGLGSRDLVTIPNTVYLNRSRLRGMTTAHKLTTISRACFRGQNPEVTGNMSAFKKESCHALQKGLHEGWMTEDIAEKWCYRPASRGCNRLATACQSVRWDP